MSDHETTLRELPVRRILQPEERAACLAGADAPRRTCGTCAHRNTWGSCLLDVQDPQGREIVTSSPRNWQNRETFGCNEWDEK